MQSKLEQLAEHSKQYRQRNKLCSYSYKNVNIHENIVGEEGGIKGIQFGWFLVLLLLLL